MAAVAATRHLRQYHQTSPVAAWKARKTPQELAALAACLVRDGQAMVRAYRWLEAELAGGRGVDEYRFGQEIGKIRARDPRCRGESFAPIVGWGANGAVVHYSAAAVGSKTIAGRGLLLVDTGGQYEDGTTDMTRTLLLGGAPTPEEKRAYTLVLQGHVRLSMARFPVGTNGAQLDTLARQSLWERGLNYGHGTGHGVGFYLCVHEGPQRIAPTQAAAAVALEPGNLLSNEPGFYAAGSFGVRIENLVAVAEDPDCPGFLCFHTLTVCPYEPELIEAELLTPAERDWVNAYQVRARELLSPGLDAGEKAWLEKRTRPI
jgi:Xaa-Pro aminopeptidase